MRLLVALLFCSQAVLSSPVNGEQTFPYKAYVAVDDVYVRSGPGQNYYPTDKLKRGQEVEVYRHDPGGWCAIRPVDGSFTWVSGRYLKPTSSHLAVVTEDGVSARVGSRFSTIREVVQVRLQKGEVVEILEAPPRGRRARMRGSRLPRLRASFAGCRPSISTPTIPVTACERCRPARGMPISQRASEAAAAIDRFGCGRRNRCAASSAKPRSLTAEEYQAELERIELDLSAMVIEEPTAWSFDSLRQRTNQLLDEAQTAVERGRARLLANKIARFDDIKQRQDAVLAMRRRDRPQRPAVGRPAAAGTPTARSRGQARRRRPLRRRGTVDAGRLAQSGRSALRLDGRVGRRALLRHAGAGGELAELPRPGGGRDRHPRLHARATRQPHHGPARHAAGRIDVAVTGLAKPKGASQGRFTWTADPPHRASPPRKHPRRFDKAMCCGDKRLMRNIELKARLVDLDTARKVAAVIATKRLGPQHQIDTYFHCLHGRLKLRQIDGLRAELIWYDRADQKDPKPSDYQLVPLSNPETLKAALAGGAGRSGSGGKAAGDLPLSQRAHPFGRCGRPGLLPRVGGRARGRGRRSGRPGHDR